MASVEKIITLSIAQHREEERLFAAFTYDKQLTEIIKTIPGRKWSNTKKQWHFNLNT